MELVIREARIPDELDVVRELFHEYAASIGIDLCFQGFEQELAELPGKYARPAGGIWLATDGARAGGCVALRPLDAPHACEIKRLFVRDQFRGCGLGRRLAEHVLHAASIAGYHHVRLDTLPSMASAIALYRSLGFSQIEPYYHNPVRGALFLGRTLAIHTARLKLVPATVALARAELGDRPAFARTLGASVPDNWPPETLADALPMFLAQLEAAPDRVGWFGWYALALGGAASAPVLVGSGGFTGAPQDGTVEIGYSVLPQFQQQGYATEIVEALVRWALDQPGVHRIVAETEWANPASVRVLSKAGFAPAGPAAKPDGARFERSIMRPDDPRPRDVR
jgi:RimJ/RimL family protein N-acetyltransferase